jgi:hypothetical protein
MKYSFMKGKYWILYVVSVGIALAIIFFGPQRNSYKADDTTSIILAPHIEDVSLSLGELVKNSKHQTIVATFFAPAPAAEAVTNTLNLQGFKDVQVTNLTYPQSATLETITDIQSEITKDIQGLIASVGDKKVSIYAPAYFTETSTNPDHAAVHQAYIDVIRSFPKDTVAFYIYEDAPYAAEFAKTSAISVQKNIEDHTGLLLEKVGQYYRVSPY